MRPYFNPFFNGFHSSTLVQVIGNKSAGKIILNRVDVCYLELSQKRPDFEKTKPEPRRRDSNTIFTPETALNNGVKLYKLQLIMARVW